MALLSLSIVIFILLVVFAVIAVMAKRYQHKMFKKTGKHPEGHYMGVGIAFGMPLGFFVSIPLGILLGSDSMGISLGPAFGVAIGSIIGSILEKKHAHKLRPLTREEVRLKHISVVVGFIALLAGVVAFVLFMYA